MEHFRVSGLWKFKGLEAISSFASSFGPAFPNSFPGRNIRARPGAESEVLHVLEKQVRLLGGGDHAAFDFEASMGTFEMPRVAL